MLNWLEIIHECLSEKHHYFPSTIPEAHNFECECVSLQGMEDLIAQIRFVSIRDSKPLHNASIVNKHIYFIHAFSEKSFLSLESNVNWLIFFFSKDSPSVATHEKYMRCYIVVLCTYFPTAPSVIITYQ